MQVKKIDYAGHQIPMPSPLHTYEGYMVHDHHFMPTPFMRDGYQQLAYNNHGCIVPYPEPYGLSHHLSSSREQNHEVLRPIKSVTSMHSLAETPVPALQRDNELL